MYGVIMQDGTYSCHDIRINSTGTKYSAHFDQNGLLISVLRLDNRAKAHEVSRGCHTWEVIEGLAEEAMNSCKPALSLYV